MAYTVHATEQTADLIEQDLDLIVGKVRSSDPGLRALILTGGFARGEGAVLDGQPQNDYDLVAIRTLARPIDYDALRLELEDTLGMHVDLASIQAWRLPWVSNSIFWYETARRGRVLCGENLLSEIPIRTPNQIDPREGLRLLVNRAAGLLFSIDDPPHERRLQAAKGFLAALDVHLLVKGAFPPSQRERWSVFESLLEHGKADASFREQAPWFSWAFKFKTNPEAAREPEADAVWRHAASSILDAVPVALDHAGFASLAAYRRADGVLDHVWYAWKAGGLPGGRRVVLNPTGRVRVATIRLLDASMDGDLDEGIASALMGDLADVEEPLTTLEGLRKATLQ